ncbi:hypothetical protein Scep_016800 [Stephania cephalantha]|uniref:Uncharacterized protein n=1 Tax=Stephania cephalantha TaxID=152367 RepID=A0AAP0INI6_9MAGN
MIRANIVDDRPREVCDGSTDPALETICGRPLGVQFNEKNCSLYIADAYYGLLERRQHRKVNEVRSKYWKSDGVASED